MKDHSVKNSVYSIGLDKKLNSYMHGSRTEAQNPIASNTNKNLSDDAFVVKQRLTMGMVNRVSGTYGQNSNT